jgi:hypothetical protein
MPDKMSPVVKPTYRPKPLTVMVETEGSPGMAEAVSMVPTGNKTSFSVSFLNRVLRAYWVRAEFARECMPTQWLTRLEAKEEIPDEDSL